MPDQHVVNLYVKEIIGGIYYDNCLALMSDHPLLPQEYTTMEFVSWPIQIGHVTSVRNMGGSATIELQVQGKQRKLK